MKKDIVINTKRISMILVVVFLGLCIYLTNKQFEFKKLNFNLEEDNYFQSEKINLLQDSNDNLQSELEDVIIEMDKYKNLYSDLFAKYEELKSINSNQYYNNNSSSNNSNNPPKDLITAYFDGGIIIKPTFNNIHLLMTVPQDQFGSVMIINGYSLLSNNSGYVNNDASCCHTIDKNGNSVSMIFTKSIQTDIESIMSQSNINYTYEDGFKVYSYKLNYQNFKLYLQSSSSNLIIVLKKL